MQKVKGAVRRFLALLGSRHRVNDFWWYRIYLFLFYRQHFRTKQVEKRFYRNLIPNGGRGAVFDIGANVGDKTRIFSELAERVIAVEPTPSLATVLQQRFQNQASVIIVPKAVGAAEGKARLRLLGGGGGCNTLSSKHAQRIEAKEPVPFSSEENTVEVVVTTLDKLIETHGAPRYIKIDVEGYEIDVLKGLTARVPLLSFEANLPDFARETVTCVQLIESRFPATEFNCVATEPPQKFVLKSWISAPEMVGYVEQTKEPYLEIYCRSKQVQPDLGPKPVGAATRLL
jgi:FkbM family methyltransferase